jgi:predicted ester cyclase
MPAAASDAVVEANKALLRRYKVGILNRRDVDALGEVAAVDYLDHAAFPGQGAGLAGLKQRITTIIEALDPLWTIHDVVAERDMVVLRWSHTGTHVGEFMGVPPTGRRFVSRGIDMYRVRDGLMVEHWNVVDMYGFRQQVGALPGPWHAGW